MFTKMKRENVIRIVPSGAVPEYQDMGFIICEESNGGGVVPPHTPSQDVEPDNKTEVPTIEIQDYNHRKHLKSGKYWNQLNVPESKEYCEQEGIQYPENATLKVLREIIGKYVKTLPQGGK